MKSTTEVRRLLGPLDPAKRQPHPSDTAVRESDLARILASDPTTISIAGPARSPLRSGRTWIAPGLAASVAVAVALVVVVGAAGTHTSSAYAATPAPLRYQAASSTESAGVVLRTLAKRAAAAPTPSGTGKYEHLVVTTWSLTTRINGKQVTSAVVPMTTQTYKAADGSGRVIRRFDSPVFSSSADRARWQRAGSPGADATPQTSSYTPGQFPQMFAGRAPTDPTALSSWLRVAHPSQNGPAESLIAATDLVKEQVLTSSQRATLLQVIAAIPGLISDGAVTDRAGRQGAAFSLVSDYSGLPTKYTVIVAPNTGQLLGFEQTLIQTAGALNVPIPSVIEYETYEVADRSND